MPPCLLTGGRINSARFPELEARAAELPTGTLAERFAAAMEAKFALLQPYRPAIAALLASLLDPRHELGALSDATEWIRLRVMGVFSTVLLGATDVPADLSVERAAVVTRALYGAHLGLVLLWTQDRSAEAQAGQVGTALARDLLALLGPALAVPELEMPLARVDGLLRPLLMAEEDDPHTEQARELLLALFRHRRLHNDSPCVARPCPQCLALHIPRVRRCVALREPLHLVLPAFPAKSPSASKVLGTLPDMAEEVALRYLQHVCDEIRQVYTPGVRLTLCSDGRVFSDLVGVSDTDVTRYDTEIRALLPRLGCRSFDTFALEDLFEGEDFAVLRERLCVHYAEPREEIEARAAHYPHHRALFNGIHRFLCEEHPTGDPPLSRTRIREQCKPLAYEVIRRSDAWGRLVAECFPAALRLSIHPQDPHSEKIGILLGDADDAWITPWHGVAVRCGGQYRLMKRSDAEAMPGSRLVFLDGRPSHFVLGDEP